MHSHSFRSQQPWLYLIFVGLFTVTACSSTADEDVDAPPTVPQVDIPTHECGYDGECADLTDPTACVVGTCVEGSCTTKASPTWSPCDLATAGECERGACNSDGTCVAITVENGAPCQTTDWDACTGYSCTDGVCGGISIAVCDDVNPCTDDSCDPTEGCVHTANMADCDDLNSCTGDDVCSEGVCAGETELCTCFNDEDCDAYDDGDLCNGLMACDMDDLICVPLQDSAVVCEPGEDSCYDNVCNPENGACEEVDNGTCQCQADADCADYEDGDLCNGTLVCDVATSQCVVKAETVVTCQESTDGCTIYTCDGTTGLCESGAAADGTVCDDGDPCTGCDDGDGGCDGTDFCSGGACVAGSGQPCACTTTADCASLEDGDACNGTLTCNDAGECVLDASTLVTCDDQEPPGECQTLVCNGSNGLCEAQPIEDCVP